MNGDLISALKQLEKERNIPLELLREAVEGALTSSYRKTFHVNPNIKVRMDWKTGATQVVATLTVAPRVKDQDEEISISQARKKQKEGKVVHIYPMDPELLPDIDMELEEDELFFGQKVDVVIEENPKSFGRIAAQTTKQVIMQKIREVERDLVFNEYVEKEGHVMSGIIQRSEHRTWIVDVGKLEGVIPTQEQVSGEHFRKGERIKVYVLKVEKGTRAPQVILSRTHPGLIKGLFALEIPEIHQGLIEIQNVVREPGARSKVSVKANEPNIDPLGACVGPRGSRVQMIVDELRGEKIDIINYTEDPFLFVSNSLSPARVLTVTLDPGDNSALVIVPDEQFSLAIGKEGQNVRLAAKLTGWKIDIKSESQSREVEEELKRKEEERKKREEEARIRKEQEAEERLQREKEEEERLKREREEELRRLEEEELIRAEQAIQEQDEEKAPEAPRKERKARKYADLAQADPRNLDEFLEEIPDDIPVDQYIALAFRDSREEEVVVPVADNYEAVEEEDEGGSEKTESVKRKKADKKKKKKRKGSEIDELFVD